jgi:hypothetical protein
LFAIPTAILASGFSESESPEILNCKKCGHIIEK